MTGQALQQVENFCLLEVNCTWWGGFQSKTLELLIREVDLLRRLADLPAGWPEEKNESFVDINGFEENPIKNVRVDGFDSHGFIRITIKETINWKAPTQK